MWKIGNSVTFRKRQNCVLRSSVRVDSQKSLGFSSKFLYTSHETAKMKLFILLSEALLPKKQLYCLGTNFFAKSCCISSFTTVVDQISKAFQCKYKSLYT